MTVIIVRLLREPQEARQSCRYHQAVHLPLQLDESCGIERALHGDHYPRFYIWRRYDVFGVADSSTAYTRTSLVHPSWSPIANVLV